MINETDLKDVSKESTNNVHWDDVQHKPEEYNPKYHTHAEYAKRYHQHSVNDIEGIANLEKVGHIHDERYYRKEEVDSIINSTVIPRDTNWKDVIGKPEKFPAMEHTHNESYYTRSEIDAKLRRYASKSHMHTTDDILGDDIFGDSNKENYIYTKFIVYPEDFHEDEFGLFCCQIKHNLGTTNLDVIAKDLEDIFVLVDINCLDENNIMLTAMFNETVVLLIKTVRLLDNNNK